MAALVAVVSLGLLAYVPGRFLLRLILPADGRPPADRLLVELLLGNAAVGLAAFGLAEAGRFSLWGVLGVLLLVLVLAAARSRTAPASGYRLADFAGVALLLASLAWFAPPFDTTLYGNDSSVYVGSGLSLARHGSIPYADPTIEQIPLAERQDFFPPYGREAAPPFLRLSGGLLLPSLEHARVLPAFHHLLSVWSGLGFAIAGDGGATAPALYFAALSLWAVAAFVMRLAGPAAAAFAVILMALFAPQYWYSRFLMPEVPSQYFLWAGLVAATHSHQQPTGRLGLAAGLGLGMAGLMRLDGLAHVAASLALWRALAPAGSWPASRGFLPAFLVVALWALLHQLLFPTHYYPEAVEAMRGGMMRLRDLSISLGLAAALGMAAASPARFRSGPAIRAFALLAFGAYGVATILSTRSDFPVTWEWLVTYLGWPALAFAAAGVPLWIGRSRSPAQSYALVLGLLVLAQLFYDPRVTPAPLWGIRRFVPVVVPLITIAASLVLDSVWRRRRALALALLAALLIGIGWRNAFAYRTDAFQQGMAHVRTLAAQLPEGAVLVVDPTLGIESQLHIALWSAADPPTYLLAPGMRQSFARLRQLLANRPMFWLGAGSDSALRSIAEIADPVASYRFGIGTRRLDWYDARDDLWVRDVTLWLYRLRPVAPADPAASPTEGISAGGALH